ncbi:hypothetical protein ACO1KB_03090 [Leptospira interrogans serovar Szwajizak]|uniref:hypothetical protein n=1 Tax=Leptospira interrogans TaxID=173 RepID=UPI00034DCB91|nr:hypothetical protein [Leptospira interrogans]
MSSVCESDYYAAIRREAALSLEIPKELQHYVATAGSNIEFKKLNETLFTKAFKTQ